MNIPHKIIGHDPALSHFIKSFNSGKMHHAWLLCGEKGIGKASLANFIAQMVLSYNGSGDIAAFHNPITASKIIHGSHPDYYLLSSDHEEKRSSIGVDEVRQLIKFMQLTPVEGTYKVAVIDCSDDLTVSAANALLKVLEEPPSGVLFLLVCHTVGNLLPTIRSRCTAIKLDSPDMAAFNLILEKSTQKVLENDEIQELFQLSRGSVGMSLRILENNAVEYIRKIKHQLAQPNLVEATELAQHVASNNELWPILSHFIIDFLRQQIKFTALRNVKQTGGLLTELAKNIKLVEDCEAFHLDKASVLLSIFKIHKESVIS